jgi:hypothetical protein
VGLDINLDMSKKANQTVDAIRLAAGEAEKNALHKPTCVIIFLSAQEVQVSHGMTTPS